ncbi:MAG TPA: response regulator [Pirellulales bacterium]|nr:response regulator [Pirellulales bacterium]
MSSSVSPMRVLVVDDCDDAAVTMAFLLKRYGHEVVVAHSGEDALEKAPRFHPDVLFIDLTMPGIDGFGVAMQLRRMTEFAETPLVAVSGYVDAEHQSQASTAGFTDFLPKPFPLIVLEATMRRAAARISAAREATKTEQPGAKSSTGRMEESPRGLADRWPARCPPQRQAIVSHKRSA